MSEAIPAYTQTQTQRYPYRMLHSAECKVGQRAKSSATKPLAQVAEEYAQRGYLSTEHHDACIPVESLLALNVVIKAAQERKQAAYKRRDTIIDAAVAAVAADTLLAAVGPLTDVETAQYAAMQKQLKEGTFRPHSVRDLRKVAIKDFAY